MDDTVSAANNKQKVCYTRAAFEAKFRAVFRENLFQLRMPESCQWVNRRQLLAGRKKVRNLSKGTQTS